MFVRVDSSGCAVRMTVTLYCGADIMGLEGSTLPTIFRMDGFRFFFYSNEGDPLEPLHVHVFKAGSEAKFWLEPEVHLASNDGFDAKTLRKLLTMVTSNRSQIERVWYEYFA